MMQHCTHCETCGYICGPCCERASEWGGPAVFLGLQPADSYTRGAGGCVAQRGVGPHGDSCATLPA